MPTYDYRCQDCGTRFSLFYKTYADYDEAVPQCPECKSSALSRLITSVRFSKPSRDYSSMSSEEMLSVLDSGDSRQVGEMFQQIGGTSPEMGKDFHEATEQLLRGESMDKVEKNLRKSENSTNEA
jgi:putative FmdB family regulatory protein